MSTFPAMKVAMIRRGLVRCSITSLLQAKKPVTKLALALIVQVPTMERTWKLLFLAPATALDPSKVIEFTKGSVFVSGNSEPVPAKFQEFLVELAKLTLASAIPKAWDSKASRAAMHLSPRSS